VLEADLRAGGPVNAALQLTAAMGTTTSLVLGLPDRGLLHIRGVFDAALLVDDIQVL
jgi:hypothetical protein